MEILCYLPIGEIIPEGIPYVRSLMHELEIQHPGLWILEIFYENMDVYL
jgi:hypothetical protein